MHLKNNDTPSPRSVSTLINFQKNYRPFNRREKIEYSLLIQNAYIFFHSDSKYFFLVFPFLGIKK